MKKLLKALLGITPFSIIGSTVVSCDPVPFEIKIDLENDIEQTELGDIEFVKSEMTNLKSRSTKIFNKIVEKNSKIKKDHAKYFLMEIKESEVTLQAASGYEENVSGTATFSYTAKQVKQNINELIRITSLGEFEEVPDEQAIFDKAKDLNSTFIGELAFEDVDIVINDNSATITAKEDSQNYIGSVTVKWTVKSEVVDINDLIKIKALGEFDATPTEQEVFDTIKTLNSSTIGELAFADVEITIGTDSATIEAVGEAYTGSVDVTWTIAAPELIDINDLIKVKDLGEFDAEPNEQEVFDAVKAANDSTIGELAFADVEITIGTDSATIKAVDEAYTGSVTVKWTIKDEEVVTVDINDLIKIKALGEFDATPTEQEVFDTVKTLNSSTIGELTFADVEITIGTDSATIEAVGEAYTGSVDVAWTIAAPDPIDINDLIEQTDLGTLAADANEQTVFDKFIELNPQLEGKIAFDDVEITLGDATATIAVKSDNEQYTGSIEVTWSVDETSATE